MIFNNYTILHWYFILKEDYQMWGLHDITRSTVGQGLINQIETYQLCYNQYMLALTGRYTII